MFLFLLSTSVLIIFAIYVNCFLKPHKIEHKVYYYDKDDLNRLKKINNNILKLRQNLIN